MGVRSLTEDETKRMRECLTWLHAQPFKTDDEYHRALNQARETWPDIAHLIGFDNYPSHEVVAHWERGSALVKLEDGAYRVKRGILSDVDFIQQLEDHVISKHNALLIAMADSMLRPLPVCPSCWNERNPDKPCANLIHNSDEICVVCEGPALAGLYVRMKVVWT